MDGAVCKVPALGATGVMEAGHRLVLGLRFEDKESASNWRELFKNEKRRDPNAKGVALGIIDGLNGLARVFKGEFPRGEIQGCQQHVAHNVPANVPMKLKKTIDDEMGSIL